MGVTLVIGVVARGEVGGEPGGSSASRPAERLLHHLPARVGQGRLLAFSREGRPLQSVPGDLSCVMFKCIDPDGPITSLGVPLFLDHGSYLGVASWACYFIVSALQFQDYFKSYLPGPLLALTFLG